MEVLGVLLVPMVIGLAVSAVIVVAHWQIYEKAGQPGWAVLVPFYAQYILIVEILKMPPVWFWLLLVPCANFVVLIILGFMIPFKLAEMFGKDTGFALGLLFLGVVFYPILAFGDAKYQGGRRRRYDDDYDDEEDEDDRPRKKKKSDDNW